MKLIEVYSTHAGLQIDRPILKDEFYPLSENNYITFHSGAGFGSKVYDFWQQVIFLMKRVGIEQKIVQIGMENEPLIEGVDIDLRGKNSIRQNLYVLKGAKLHFGNDSFPVHASSAYNVPVVALYGSTTIANHSPYWKNPKSILIEADRGSDKPSYSTSEPNKVINKIKPETVANAVLKILGKESTSIETVYMGKAAAETAVEYIPNFPFNPNVFKNIILTARLDYHFDETHLFNLLQQRKVNIITDKPINTNALKLLRPHVTMLNFEVKEDTEISYLEEMKKTGVPFKLFTRAEPDQISSLRFKFFDIGNLDEIRDPPESELPKTGSEFKTNKILLSEGKFFHSYAHVLENISSEFVNQPQKIIRNEHFAKDLNFFWIYV